MATTVSAPSWWPQWGPLVTMYAAEFGVPLSLAAAVLQMESGGNPNAISYPVDVNGKSLLNPDGSQRTDNGLFQVANGSFNPATNIQQGLSYLGQQLQAFGGDFSLALAAYNAGPGAVGKYNGVPPYPSTQGYVKLGLSLANQYAGAFSVLGPTLPAIPATPVTPVIPGLPTLPLPSLPPVPASIYPPQTASLVATPTGVTPALAPLPAPTPTGFWPVDAFNSLQNTASNAILSIERFFFIAVGLFFIGLGLWLLVKAENRNGSAAPA